MFYTFDGSLARVRTQLALMRSLPAEFGEDLFVSRPEVSGWSAGEHLDHCAKVTASILHVLAKDEPIDLRPVSAVGRLILEIDWIPRGKGRSPEKLRGAVVDARELDALWMAAEALLAQISAAPPRERTRPLLRHPVFGGLNATQSMRFAGVHSHHHLRIVREVARAF